MHTNMLMINDLLIHSYVELITSDVYFHSYFYIISSNINILNVL